MDASARSLSSNDAADIRQDASRAATEAEDSLDEAEAADLEAQLEQLAGVGEDSLERSVASHALGLDSDRRLEKSQESRPYHRIFSPGRGQERSQDSSTVKSHLKHLVVNDLNVYDATTYDADYLLMWRSMKPRAFSVFNRSHLWYNALKLGGLSLVIAFFAALFIPDPSAVDINVFAKVRAFLSTFVGLLLGFFMSVSVSRWWRCAEAFLDLFTSVKQLQIDLHAYGVPEADMIHVLRYGVTSAWILSTELTDQALPVRKQKAARKLTWHNLENRINMDETLGKLTPAEWDSIRNTSDPSAHLWIWIGSYLGHLSEEGIIPPMGSPSFTRFLSSSQRSFDAIREIRSCVRLQAPFIYAHMLAYLVHVNNLVNAISFGIVCGTAAGTFLSYMQWNPLFPRATATRQQAFHDLQGCMVSFIFSCFGPFVYQALLECSIAISQPFGNEDAVVPTRRFIQALEHDIHDGFLLMKAVSWKPPSFCKKVDKEGVAKPSA